MRFLKIGIQRSESESQDEIATLALTMTEIRLGS
jgi:hypothetical protein